VPRAERVTLVGFDKNNKPVKIKAWGLLAQVFQHETDHLQGKLFIDRTKKVYSNDEA
jgi:peptide deformylase